MRPRGHLRVRIPARRLFIAMTGLALTLGALPAVIGSTPGTAAVITRANDAAVTAPADDGTVSGNTMRDSWDSTETAMGPSVVPTFTQLFATPVGGQVFAQPLVIGSTVFVATENDWVYGLDAATGAISWQTHLGSAWVIAKSSVPKLATCGDLTPNVGVTGTPVYDPSSGNVYFFANVLNANGNPKFYLYGVDPTNGNIVSKTLIWGSPSNDSNITFNPQYEGQRTGALLLNGSVYGAFASHCDKQPYAGYVAGVNISTQKFTLWTDESGVTYNEAGIWQSGGGLMTDGSGSIFLTSGNGVSPAKGAGTSPHGQLAESVIRLTANPTTGALSAKDFFSPANAPSLDAADTDFGSGGPVAIPFGTSTFPDLLAQDGKDGRIFLLNRDNLGGREQGSGSGDNDLFVTKSYGGAWEHPAVFGDTAMTQSNAGTSPTDNDFLISVGKNDVLRVFRFGDNSSDKPVISDVGASSLTYPYTSGSPMVTSNGDDPTTAVVWEVHAGGETGAGSEIDAYSLGNLVSSGTPSPCTSSSQCIIAPIWHSTIPGDATKFSTPATSNGRVYIGTRGTGTTGEVIGYGVAPPSAPPVAAATTTLPQTSVSSTTSKDVSIAAKNPVTITNVAASTGASNALAPVNQFTVGALTETPAGSTTAHPVTLPVTLAKGAKLHALVKFAPAAPGTADGTVSFTTNTGRVRHVPVTGTGAKPGLYAVPGTLAFPFAVDQGLIDVPVGISVVQLVDIINGGSTTEQVSSVTPPTGQFSADNLPIPGQKIKPGQALVVQVTYAPQHPGPASGSLTVTDSSGKNLTIPLSGSAIASVSQVTPAEATVAFGPVPVGQTVMKTVHVTNTGNVPTTVSVPAVPTAPFHSRFRVFAGLPFNPGYSLTIPVSFTPTKTGTVSQPYVFRWKDRLGTHSLTVTLTGTGV